MMNPHDEMPGAPPEAGSAAPETVRVWDPLIRIFHWSLVAAFAIGWITGDDAEDLHEVAGYVVLGLVVFRVLWGLVGTRHARFGDFVRGPRTVRRYLASLLTARPIHYLGHNPAGGWMVVALLAVNLLLCWSGLALIATEGRGPLATVEVSVDAWPLPAARANDDDDHHRHEDDGEDPWEDVHEVLANLALGLVLIHVAGVVVSSVLHHENLVRAMITGRKRAPPP